MNVTEQENYLLAAFVSLIIHFLVLIVYLPGIPTPQPAVVEEVPVSLVELSSEDKIRQLSVALNTLGRVPPDQGKTKPQSPARPGPPPQGAAPIADQTVTDAVGTKPETKGDSREDGALKSTVDRDLPLPSATTPSDQKEQAASGSPASNLQNQEATGGDAGDLTGSEASGSGQPRSLGTGEALVRIIGPMPTYPSAALKEGKEGEVSLRLLVKADGQLDLAIVTRSSGDIRLDYAAASSIERKWKFASINEGYYIDLIVSFDIQIGTSVKFVTARTRVP